MSTADKTREILSTTKSHLIEFGWIQKRAYAKGDDATKTSYLKAPACLIGAMAAVEKLVNANADAAWEATIAVNKVTSASPVSFNDAPGRTLDEVLAKLDEAIAAVR